MSLLFAKTERLNSDVMVCFSSAIRCVISKVKKKKKDDEEEEGGDNGEL